MYRSLRRFIGFLVVSLLCAITLALPHHALASSTGEFSLQVSPSPLVATLKPGQSSTLELTIRNTGSQTENLKIAPRSFSIDNAQQLHLSDTEEPQIASWLSFSAPTFSVQPGQTTHEDVTVHVPANAGFSYSLALVISRVGETPQPSTNSQTLKGSIAIFGLFNIDKPGATRSLQITRFAPTKNTYEYLPAEFQIDFKNTGNTIVQPSGNVFVQRGDNDKTPIDTLLVNSENGYILPGKTRTFTVDWDNGFQVQRTSINADGTTKSQLTWNWGNLGNIRFGSYTAKLVAVYNDGQRDVPLEAQLTFWVFPWKLLLGVLVVILLILAGVWSMFSKAIRLGKRMKR